MQPEEERSFDDIVATLQDHLGVPEADILHLFRETIKCNESGAFTISLEEKNIAIVSKDTGVSYKIGIQTIKQLNKETKQMEPRVIPILLSREHMPSPTARGSRKGYAPDSFEAGPGRHPADEE